MLNSHAAILFIENKGQITDQNHNARPDIDFSVKAAAGLNVFIGNGCMSYQFSRSLSPALSKGEGGSKRRLRVQDNYKTSLSKGEGRGEATFTLYRMDVTLIGANKNAQLITEEKQD